MTKPLKYQSELDKHTDCDFSSFSERERNSFRIIFEDIADERNFLPVYMLDSTRPRGSFTGWGLSCYDTEQFIRAKVDRITKDAKNLPLKIGTHLASGVLEANDGLSDDSNQTGHFTHFEYKNVILHLKFKIIGQI